jgi:antitoxin (DNA-binding transcriptional repressor) of toxin-antitoxin stability system
MRTMMPPVNMLEAKSTLSRLVQAVEEGREAEVVIARNGRPVARRVPIEKATAAHRLGVAKGRFEVPASIDVHQAEVVDLFLGASGGSGPTGDSPPVADAELRKPGPPVLAARSPNG